MRALLVVLTVVEVVLVLGVVVAYLVVITRSLRRTAGTLGRVTFGVRAIETQVAPVGPTLSRLNQQLGAIDAALGELAASGDGARRG